MNEQTIKQVRRWTRIAFALIGVFAMSISAFSGLAPRVHAATAKTLFTDTSTSYAKEAIDLLVSEGIATGTSSTSFEPKKAVSRAEFAAFAVRLLGLEPVSNDINPFSDVSKSAWYYGNVAAMTNLSILEGKGQGTFQPNASITREEAAALLSRMLKQQSTSSSSLNRIYTDASSISEWARPYVQNVYTLGLMKGSDGLFRPKDKVTREEAAMMLAAVLQKSTWYSQLNGSVSKGIQLGWQYNSTTTEFKQQVAQSPVNTLVPRWFFLNSSMQLTNQTDTSLVNWAETTGRQLWPLLGNRSNAELTHQMLSSATNRNTVVSQITAYVKQYGFEGINVDFENVLPEDRTNMTLFITALTTSLHAVGAVVSVDVSPDLGTDWTEAFDYAALGEIADYMILMGYEEHWNGSPNAGSVASLSWLENALNTMLSDTESAKIIVALPLYTRDWSLLTPATDSWDITLGEQGSRSQTVGTTKHWDDDVLQYVLKYVANGTSRAIWAEDSRSLSSKTSMISKNGVAGLAYWYMGGETEDVWKAISNAIRFESYQF